MALRQAPEERMLPAETSDDLVLVRRVGERNENALRALYERYGGLTYTIAARITGDAQIAQEVTQDVFLRCWEAAASFDSHRGSVHAWLMGIARNRSIDVLRSRQHQSRMRDRELLPQDDHKYPASEGGEIEATALRLSVNDALAELPLPQRQAIELVLSAGMTQREIAEALDLPLGTVKTRIRDGMMKLRANLVGAPATKRTRT